MLCAATHCLECEVIRQPFRARCSPTTNPAIADSDPCQLRALRFRGALRRLTRFGKKECRPEWVLWVELKKFENGPPRASVRAANLQFDFLRFVAQTTCAIDNLLESWNRQNKRAQKYHRPPFARSAPDLWHMAKYDFTSNQK